jgi:dihydrofolate reductase
MQKVAAYVTMSLDGFMAGPNDEIDKLFRWYRAGDVDFPVEDGELTFRLGAPSAAVLQERFNGIGAIVTGRRDFDVSRAWGGRAPLGKPAFIVTHSIPGEWAGPDSPFTFVTDGVASAVRQARDAAGGKNVVVGSSKTIQQCLTAGLLDELHIDLVPLLLADGIRLLENLGTRAIELEPLAVIPGTGVTHLSYRVVK